MPTTYASIAEDLRSRVASGRLKPGAKLPSVRMLARKWRVAPATAARALQSVVREGFARAVPRSGYRVTGTPPPPETSLSRERIIHAAIQMADRVGLAGLSVRALAEELGVPPMSLYRHVENKEHLVWLMVDVALGTEPLPVVEDRAWREGLERATRQEWRVLQRHPWLAKALNVSRPGTQPNALAFAERVMRALEGTRLTAARKLTLHVLLHSFVQGLAVNIEAEAQARRETGVSDEAYMRGQEKAFEALVASGAFPAFARIHRRLAVGFELDLDALFELGLTALLDGVSLWIDPRGARGRARRR